MDWESHLPWWLRANHYLGAKSKPACPDLESGSRPALETLAGLNWKRDNFLNKISDSCVVFRKE